MRRGPALAVAAALSATALTIAAPPAQAAVQIDVAPSANGLVMAGVPTTISVAGFKGTARVTRFDERSGNWTFVGTVSSGRPLRLAFPANGRVLINIAPRNRSGKTFVVPVYGRFVPNTDPMTFGDVQLPHGRPIGAFDPPMAMAASAGCALGDVGLLMASGSGQSTSGTLLVQSTGAPEARLALTDAAATLLRVPVKGDATVSIVDLVNPDYIASRGGVVWYCTGPVRLPQVPS